jgi:hypothetical protein
MIPLVGFIVATYAIARLIQVPIEQGTSDKKLVLLWLISISAVLAISGFTLMLGVSSVGSGR